MDRKYRILHLITRLELGGAQQNTLFCIEHHDRRRFEVELIAGAGGILDDQARRIAGVRVQLVDYLEHPIAPLTDLRALLRLRAYFKSARIDLVHTHSSKAGILGRLAAFLAGVPVIVHTAHGWSFNNSQPAATRRLYVQLERLAARVTDRILVVASGHRSAGLAHGIGRPDQYRVLRSGIDSSLYRRPTSDGDVVRRELGLDPAAVVVGGVCCLKPQKAPLDFVRAGAAALAEAAEGTELHFVLAGDGELRPAVERLVRELGVEGRFHLLGWRRDVPQLLQAFDVFLLTSLFEGLPRSVLQAMAAGVPVVATAVDGTPEVVEHEATGLLVSPGRPREAARAVLRLIADPALRARLAEAAGRSLTDEFDITEMVRALDRGYLSLLAPDRRAAAERGGMMAGWLA
jgi:glycosyltransferase involved in cell wall biosynthesis